MKLKGKHLPLGQSGYAVIIPENYNDLWTVYNLVREGDKIEAMTHRKVSRTGIKGGDSEVVRLKLTIRIEHIEVDLEGEEMRFSGRNMTDNERVRLGAYHTITITPNKEMKIMKEVWDSVHIKSVWDCSDPITKSDLAVLLIRDGTAELFLVGDQTTLKMGAVSTNLPRKTGAAAAGYEKSWKSFMAKGFRCVEQHVNFEIVRCLIVAGPGFTKEAFRQYLLEEALKRTHKQILGNKDRILTATTSTVNRHGLQEVLSDPSISSQIQDIKAFKEIQALDAFHEMLASNAERAFYGPGHVFAAGEVGAIQTLLISDALFRSNKLKRRIKYVGLVEDVQSASGAVHIFSAAHISGEQLAMLSGIAAILRYPLPEIEDKEYTEAELFG